MGRITSAAVGLIVSVAALTDAHATARIWVGGTGVFATAGNWSPSGTPVAADTLAFSGSTTACNITTAATVTSINISVAVTVTQSAGQALIVSGTFTQSAGTFIGSNSSSESDKIDIGGNFTLSGTAAFTSTRGRLEVGGAFSSAAGTFTHNSGQLMLNSTAATQTFATNSQHFYDLTINDGLIGYWKLPEAAGATLADSSGYGQDGVPVNSPTVDPGPGPPLNYASSPGKAFNGTNQGVRITRDTLLEPAIVTLSAWVKRNGTQPTNGKVMTKTYGNALVSPYSSYELRVNSSGTDSGLISFAVGLSASSATVNSAAGALTDNAWMHLAAVFSPAGGSPQARLYINGVLSGTAVNTAALIYDTATTGDLYFGTNGNSAQYFKGTIDEVRIFNRALSEVEISALAAGYQPGTSVATQNMTGAPTVDNNLRLASGTLSAGANNLIVDGSWNNYGGVFSAGTGTVTLTSPVTTDKIRSSGQSFNNLILNSSGATWTLEDWLNVDGSLTLTSGALSPGSYAVHVADLNRSAGTLATNTGTVIIDPITTPAGTGTGFGLVFNSLRIETPNETNLTGYWKLDEGQGTVTHDATGSGNNGTLSGNSHWLGSSLPSLIDFDNHAAVTFNGTSAYVPLGNNNNFAGQITMAAWVNASDSAAFRNIVAHGYDAAGTHEVYLRVNSSNYEAGVFVSPNSYQTSYPVQGGDVGSWVHVAGVYDGTTWRLYRNGVAVGTPTVAATGSITIATTPWAIGGRGDGTSRWFKGSIDDVRIYNVGLTAAQVASLYAGGYAGTGGGATVTLGANLTVNGKLAVDVGTLSTSTFTVNAGATDSTQTADVNAGTLAVGSSVPGAVTLNGGLAVGAQGTVTETTSGGAIAVGAGKELGYAFSGSVQGFPTAAFDWNSFTFWREYITFTSFVSGAITADTVLALTANGGERYSWSLPSGTGSLLGTPRWNMETGIPPTVHYIYLITTTGNVFKVLDDGTALTTVAGWPYRNGASATATSPLANDSSNLYWNGNDGSAGSSGTGNPKMFSLTLGKALNGTPLSITSTATAAPALATVGGLNYVFFAIAGTVYQETLNLLGELTSTQPTTAVNGRVTVYNNVVYFPETNGKVWALTASTTVGPVTKAGWPYQDRTAPHSTNCINGTGACPTVSNLYVDVTQGRTCFGDQDGHVYVLDSNGTPLNGFPFMPGSAADNFQIAPLSRSGVLLIGAANGKVYEIDENNGTTSALTRTYTLPAAVSSISFNPSANGGSGAYTVGTSDGKLFYLAAGSDPTGPI